MNIITAVVWPNGKAYFFACGNQYIRYDIANDIADQFPKPVAPNWPGLAKVFPDGIDTVIAWTNGKAYFFKGNKYLAYNMDPAHEGALPGYPKLVSGNWPGLECTLANPSLWMQLTHIRCLGETNDGSASDEIYVVMFSADISGGILPPGRATMTPLLEDFDEGEVKLGVTTNWGLNDSPTPISDPSTVIFLAGMMENDESEPDAVRFAVGGLIVQLASYQLSKLTLSAMVANLKNDMFAAEGLGAQSGQPFHTDERIGTCLEIPISEADLIAARLGRIVRKELDFVGDGGHYQVRWQMGRAGTNPDLSPQW